MKDSFEYIKLFVMHNIFRTDLTSFVSYFKAYNKYENVSSNLSFFEIKDSYL
jgi:hypothetical protein